MRIPFNKPYLSGRELEYVQSAISSGKISGDGMYTKKCHEFFEKRYGMAKALLTTSCTDALEMSALLTNIQPGDEVIMPSYTFVSTANAFVLRGAKIVFCDSRNDHPGMDEEAIEALITDKTKAIVPVHYAGVACHMDKITALAEKYGLYVIEDAAQAIEGRYYSNQGGWKQLGTIGHLAAFSFHETKNIQCGEGGLLAVNDSRFVKRAEIIREKGTNRSAFFRGEIDKYGWVDIGSSFLPSDMLAAFLFAQLESIEDIQSQRLRIWNDYHEAFRTLSDRGLLQLPSIPDYATNNAHMYYVVCRSLEERERLIAHLKSKDILAVFHYLSLHHSVYFQSQHPGRPLPWSDFYTDRLLRLPLWAGMNGLHREVIDAVLQFFSTH